MNDFGDLSPEERQREKVEFGRMLGQRIKEVRLEKGVSQEELADRAGYYRTYVGRIENGAIATSAHTIWRLARALNVDLRELLKDL